MLYRDLMNQQKHGFGLQKIRRQQMTQKMNQKINTLYIRTKMKIMIRMKELFQRKQKR
jgi:hypothetical protein